jgi:asparagine synthase (glutamine-hydrolysing)
MCGISGVVSFKEKLASQVIKKMNDSLIHRGPDGHGIWINEEKNIAFGHRRLAILDLSENGAQPMHLEDRYTITYNGEIYNFTEIRDELTSLGYSFHSETDTEVILVAFHVWGQECLHKFDGMFAFAIYDRSSKKIFCARDRFGEKPFYYSFHQDKFYFASEMKALWAAGVPKEVNNKMLYRFLAHDLVENPRDQTETFFLNIYKLKAGHFFYLKEERSLSQKQYWAIQKQTTRNLDSQKIAAEFGALLEKSVQRRLRSDVKVGSSLSGGLDSSSIVAIISKLQKGNATFSARFPGSPKDEGKFISLVQQKFQTQHVDIPIQEEQFIANLEKLIYHQEEPFQTGSIYAQFAVYERAKKDGCTVLLDGQGADELLGGYDKDFKYYLKEIRNSKEQVERFKRDLLENHNYQVNLSSKDKFFAAAPQFYGQVAALKARIKPSKFAGINGEYRKVFADKTSPFQEFNDLKSMLAYELSSQGIEKLLKFADRNSMAHSVEVRLPFLNHEIVEFVFSLPSDQFLTNGWSKAILRNTMSGILPDEIVYRKDKIGFEAPHREWTKNSRLREEIVSCKEELIREKIIQDDFQDDWKILLAGKWLTA